MLQPPTFAALVPCQEAWVLATVRRLGVRAAEAMDLCQEVFLAAFLAWENYEPGRPLLPWLKTIVYRTVRDYLQLHRVQCEVLTLSGEIQCDTTQTPECSLLSDETQLLVTEAIQRLKPELQEVFRLSELERLPQTEIMMTLGLSESLLQSRLRRARQRVSQYLIRHCRA